MRVDTLLTQLLTATVNKTAASRRVERLREVLDAEARRRYAAEGAAPAWKAPQLGSVRLDPKDAEAYVSDDDAFASYVAERFPGEVEGTITLPAAELAAALEALEFAGVTVHRSEARVRPSFTKALLGAADVTYDEDPAGRAVMRHLDNAGTVEPIAGVDVYPPGATLVVSLDRDAKARTLAAVDAELDEAALIASSSPRPVTTVELPEALALSSTDAGADEAAVAQLEAERLNAVTKTGGRNVAAEQRLAAAVAMTGETPDPALVAEAVAISESPDPEASLAARQRAHAEAHAADVATRLADFAATGAAPATRQPGEPMRLADAIVEELDAPRDPAGERLDRDRTPYVGEGADGARRSAEIDRSELDGMAADDPLRPEREASAEAWDQQAARLELAAAVGPFAGVDVVVDDSIPPGTVELRHADGAVAATITGLDEDPEPEVTALAKLNTDDLKRAARARRLPVSGAKVILAARLHKAGVTVEDVRILSIAATAN